VLWEDFKQQCKMQTKTSVADGQGGFVVTFTDGDTFDASIVKNSSPQERVAEKQGVSATYTVTTPEKQLHYYDIFKRVSDGKLFRVTSNFEDSRPPERASFGFYQVTAEEYK
jgi:hypothetical protein